MIGDDAMSGGGGASEGRDMGINVGGAAADAREYRNEIESCFFIKSGWRPWLIEGTYLILKHHT